MITYKKGLTVYTNNDTDAPTFPLTEIYFEPINYIAVFSERILIIYCSPKNLIVGLAVLVWLCCLYTFLQLFYYLAV